MNKTKQTLKYSNNNIKNNTITKLYKQSKIPNKYENII